MLTSHSAPPAGRTFELDLRDLSLSTRHSVVFARLDEMGLEDRMVVVCEYEPEELRSEIAMWWPGQFDWCCQNTGASEWRAEITCRH